MDYRTDERLLEMKTSLENTLSVIHTTSFETPLGTMFAGSTEEGICMLEYADSVSRQEKEINALCKLLGASVAEGESKYFESLRQQLAEYFDGKRKEFDIPLVLAGTPFQQEVWRELQKIPYGSTRSYKEQSMALNNLGAIRAVGTANGANRIAILIPCHRVIGENGKLTGYGGGLWRKKWLLDLEKGQLTFPGN
jgi:AraC family transcriptional regulator of adaptative response/methylated-DNA-[protein]-cysteine methyltransferase